MDDDVIRPIGAYHRPARGDRDVDRCAECGRDLRGREHVRVGLSDGEGADAGHVLRACSWQCLALVAWIRHRGD